MIQLYIYIHLLLIILFHTLVQSRLHGIIYLLLKRNSLSKIDFNNKTYFYIIPVLTNYINVYGYMLIIIN